MFVAFEEMPGNSRVWIYQSDRVLSQDECHIIEENTKNFLSEWAAHGKGLKSSSRVIDNRFLLICVDEQAAMASGCSIDASVHFVQTIGQKLKINFFDRTLIAFEDDGQLRVEPLNSIANLVSSGIITPDTLVRDNLVPDKSSFEERWITPASNTWMKRYFKKEEA